MITVFFFSIQILLNLIFDFSSATDPTGKAYDALPDPLVVVGRSLKSLKRSLKVLEFQSRRSEERVLRIIS